MVARARAARVHIPLPAPLSELSLEQLESAHAQGLQAFRQQAFTPQGESWLALKRELAQRQLAHCRYCSHHCGVNRQTGQTGFCGLTAQPRISGEYLHYGEEAAVGVTHAIFLSGCTLHCLFCHNWRDTFDLRQGRSFSPAELAARIRLRAQNPAVRSVSFIGGTPEPHLHLLTALACELPEGLPWVFNGNATLSESGLALMEGLIDLWLPDFKFGNDRCAWELAKITDYSATVLNNLRAYRQQGPVLIRHLLMPGHLECCTRPILALLAAEFREIPLNLMMQYRPFYRAEQIEALNRRPDAAEQAAARQLALSSGLKLLTQEPLASK